MPIDTTPIPEVSSDRFRSHLRSYLDQVMASQKRLIITRHGQALAALVPVHEGRALWQVANNTAMYEEWRATYRLNEARTLRMAVMEESRAARREGHERTEQQAAPPVHPDYRR